MRLIRPALLVALFTSVSLSGQAVQRPPAAPYPTPQGTATENGLAGFAKILCSGVFVSDRTPEDVAQGSAYFFMPASERDQVKFVVDRQAKVARASLGSITREARFHGDQGCIIENPSSPGIHFTPTAVATTLPDAMSQPWPMGDRPDTSPLPAGVDRAKLDAALDAAFSDPAAQTAAFLVVHKGRIVAERYKPGITKDTQLESWSMGKSLAATLFSLLVRDGTYTLDQPAPVPLWRTRDDPRAAIKNIDLLRMSAGLKFVGNQEPGTPPTDGVLDHYFIYTGGIDAFEYSFTRPLEVPPNTQGRYRNCDPLTIAYLTKLAVTRRGENFLTWPQRALFDKIGIRRQVLETDPFGNFLITGFDYGTARNWARLGMLYLQDGIWQGQRVLPEGWSTFVSTRAPAWTRPEYGGLFWLNGIGNWNLPPETYLAAGAGGQNTWIVPSRDLVIVRMGHMRGQGPARAVTNRALGLVMEATAGPPAAQPQDTLWITLGDSDQLVEADPYTFKEIRRIKVDPKVHGLGVSADGSKVYIASDRTGNFQVIDARSGTIAEQIPLGTDPNQLALTRDGRFAFVPMRGEDAVAVVQLDPLKLIKKIAVPRGPHDAYTSADGSRIYVGAQFGSAIIVIDAAKQELLYTLPTADGVRPLALTRDGRTVYAALSNLIGFVVADVEKGVTRRVELGTLPEGIPRPYLDTFTHALHLTPDEREIWVTDDVNDLIRVVRVSDMTETSQIRVGHFPHWFTLRSDGKVLFTSLWYSDAVAAIDVATRKVLANIQFERMSGPKRIVVAPKPR